MQRCVDLAGILEDGPSLLDKFRSQPPKVTDLEAMASELLDSMERRLDRISATWINPATFRCLAPQIRQYIRRNVTPDGWDLKVTERLKGAIENAVKAESATLFDNPGRLKWDKDIDPPLEFARVLLRSPNWLMNPVTKSIIAVHEAFHGALFYRAVGCNSAERKVDFVYFERPKETTGFYGERATRFQTCRMDRKAIPCVGSPSWFLLKCD